MQHGEVLVPPHDTMPSDTKDATAPKEKAADVVVARERRETLCGVRGVYPDFLQKYRTPRCALTVLCLVSFTRSFSMNGVMMVVLPTLERRYQLKGYESGMILSSNDVASCLTMLPVAFLATQRNKPLFIGYGIATMGLGNLVVAMAHFLSPSYQLSSAGSDLCPMTDVWSSCTKSGSIRNFRYMLMIGQLISGLGATPINTVTIAYLDENLPKRKSSLYIGIFNSMTIIGPSLGFIVGGYTLTYYVDISTDVSSMGLSSKSPAWVGAWWLGSLLTAAMGFTLSVITCSFPKYLPGYDAACAEKKGDQTAVSVISMIPTSEFGQRITDLPKAIRRLLTNVPFMMLCISFSFSQMFTTGLTSMVTKFFESQLGLPSARVAYMVGSIVLVGGGFGAIIGGALVSRWNLDYGGIMRLCMYNCCFSWFGVLIFTFNCPQNVYATPDGYIGEVGTSKFNFQCNADCNCTSGLLNPICGADHVVYLSPCLAGCHRELQVKNVKMYSGCTCINSTLSEVPGLSADQLLLEAVQATRSRCPTACGLLFPFLAGVFLAFSATFLNAAPSTAASIRCVKPAERSLALGIRQIIGRLVGSIPAPVIFGGIVDQTCVSWHRSCGKSGACVVYENAGMSRGLFYALAVTLSLNMLCYYGSLLAHRRHARQRASAKKSRAMSSKD
ncbi:solute carrier organic anion transporter family member 4A1-like [Dermacentor albipictus]|uniref:solute carrier organic anion transporter family member 4A1-like n=1 Tax=Dermacentor albipictus TaxID=60249 RepID=UPI0038FC2152